MTQLNSRIKWPKHTFNPWQGCHKVGPECEHCWAEAFDDRESNGAQTHWGKKTPRLFRSDDYWNNPNKWNLKAKNENTRQGVFCASLADVFEKRSDLETHRKHLWKTIRRTPMLDWLLLTMRPENMESMLPSKWLESPRHNVWLGTSIGVRSRRKEIDKLRAIPATGRFLSIEPLLEDLGKLNLSGIDWVICGGEWGPGARGMQADWVRCVRDQCAAQGVAFYFKQWGELSNNPDASDSTAKENGGTAKGGRMLDGRTWDEMPMPKVGS